MRYLAEIPLVVVRTPWHALPYHDEMWRYVYDAIPYDTRYQNMLRLTIPYHSMPCNTIRFDWIVILQVGMTLHCRVTRINMERLQLDLTCRSSDLLDKEGKYRFGSVSVFISFWWIKLLLVCTPWKPLPFRSLDLLVSITYEPIRRPINCSILFCQSSKGQVFRWGCRRYWQERRRGGKKESE